MRIPNHLSRGFLDAAIILVLALLANAGHFAIRQGRHVICADSVQYVDGARTILGESTSAHFGFRKPGYSVILAATYLLFGNMSWGAVVVNYLAQTLLALVVYALGRQLHSRLAGWLAAILIIAQLQISVRAERIMSEVCYATIIATAFWLIARAWRKSPGPIVSDSPNSVPPSRGDYRGITQHPNSPPVSAHSYSWTWVPLCGIAMGFAWFIRSAATAPILATLICLFWHERRNGRWIKWTIAFLLPLAGFVLLECGLNHHFVGRFKPGTGTLGPSLLLRMRAFLGVPFPETEATQKCLSLLPERNKCNAYIAHKLDTWVAWHRALHDHGMDDWEFDRVTARASWEMIAVNSRPYLTSSAEIFARYLLRRDDGPRLDQVPDDWHQPCLMPVDIVDSKENQEHWYKYWTLPKRDSPDARNLTGQMLTDADEKAPFGDGALFANLRYICMTPAVHDVLGILRDIARLWPGFALLGCGLLGLNRRLCAALALTYTLDAIMVALMASDATDLVRYRYAWVGTDSTLAAAMIASIFHALRHRSTSHS
ncbi:MAG: hypothetical protein AABZ47_10910 [Planctomycetota bacterium]